MTRINPDNKTHHPEENSHTSKQLGAKHKVITQAGTTGNSVKDRELFQLSEAVLNATESPLATAKFWKDLKEDGTLTLKDRVAAHASKKRGSSSLLEKTQHSARSIVRKNHSEEAHNEGHISSDGDTRPKKRRKTR